MKENLLIVASLLVSSVAVAQTQKAEEAPENVASVVATQKAIAEEQPVLTFEEVLATRADSTTSSVNPTFTNPYGSFYFGATVTESGYTWGGYNNHNYLLLPPYENYTFRNTTDKEGNTFAWYLSKNQVSTDYDYTDANTAASSEFSYYYSPLLAVNGGTPTGNLDYLKYWKNTVINFTNGTRDYGMAPAGPYYHANADSVARFSPVWWGAGGKTSAMEGFLIKNSSVKALTDPVYKAICQQFDKPISPIVVNGMRIYARMNCTAGATIKCTVRKITDNGYIGDVVTTGTYTFESDVNNIQGNSSNGITMVEVPLTDKDEFDMDVPLVVDYGCFVMFDFTDEKITEFDPQFFSYNKYGVTEYVKNKTHGLTVYAEVTGKNASGKEVSVYPNMAVSFTSGAAVASLWASINGYIPYIGMYQANSAVGIKDRDMTDKAPVFNVPTAGAVYAMNMQCTSTAEDWIITNASGDDKLASWLKFVTLDTTVGEGDDAEPVVQIQATVEALPSSVTGRSETVVIEYEPGFTYKMTFNQGETGVGSVAVEAVSVKAVNGNFEVVAPASVSNVAVYNMAGQVVASQAVAAGANTIDGSNLAAGVYVLKFNNGATVKAVK